MPVKEKTKFIAAIFLAFAAAVPLACAADEYVQAQAAIAVKTVYSGGRYTVSQVAGIARQNGIGVVITADAFLNHWQYGLWPLRNIIKKTEETRSVLKYGIRRYLDDIKLTQEANPDMAIIGGVEVAPFYRWEGSPFRGNFAIKDWHKHIIVIGLETLKDLKGLPVIGPATALSRTPGIGSLSRLILAILLLAAGLFGIFTGLGANRYVYDRRHGLLLTQWRIIGIVLTAFGALMFINNYPFSEARYDQYHGDRGAMPYQDMIDYVNKHGGMTFWSHPEAKNIEKVGKVDIETREHSGLILETRGYTGFAIFYEGYDMVGRPGGIWDNLLVEYCKGLRHAPVWAIGSIDYEQEGSLAERMQILRTVLLVKEQGREGSLEAIRNGRMYVSKDADAPFFSLDNFTVGDASGTASAVMGQEAAVTGVARIRISGRPTSAGVALGKMKILLMRDGEPLNAFEAEAPFDITYDDEKLPGGRHYYRAEIRSQRLLLVTNPVFVTRR